MRAVAILTTTGLVALVVALLTGSTPLAVLVVGLAITGIVLLLRDWRGELLGPPAVEPDETAGEPGDPHRRLSPDQFSPDISTDPNGPSSDARAD